MQFAVVVRSVRNVNLLDLELLCDGVTYKPEFPSRKKENLFFENKTRRVLYGSSLGIQSRDLGTPNRGHDSGNEHSALEFPRNELENEFVITTAPPFFT